MAINNTDQKVRRAIFDNTKNLTNELVPSIEKMLTDSSYDIITKALDYLTFANPEKLPSYLEQTKNIDGFPGRNVKIKWLEFACLSNAKYIDQLVSFSSNAYEFRTRTNAMNSLKKLNYLDKNAVEYIIDAMLNPNSKLRNSATDVLKYFYEQLTYKRIIKSYVEEKDWQPWQEKIIKGVVN